MRDINSNQLSLHSVSWMNLYMALQYNIYLILSQWRFTSLILCICLKNKTFISKFYIYIYIYIYDLCIFVTALLDPQYYPEESCKIRFACLFAHHSICLGIFLESLVFLNFGMVLESYTKLSLTELDFLEKFFCPKHWEDGQKMGQNRVFWIFWKIWSLIFTEFVL